MHDSVTHPIQTRTHLRSKQKHEHLAVPIQSLYLQCCDKHHLPDLINPAAESCKH